MSQNIGFEARAQVATPCHHHPHTFFPPLPHHLHGSTFTLITSLLIIFTPITSTITLPQDGSDCNELAGLAKGGQQFKRLKANYQKVSSSSTS